MIDERASSAADDAHNTHERFKLIAKVTQDTIWDWNLNTGELWWNENFTTMFGYQRSLLTNNVTWWYDHLHPDDRERVVQKVHDVIEQKGAHWQDEYRFLKMDGSYAYVFDRGYTLHDEQGPCRMVGSMLDITEQKKAQQQLTESEDRLRIALEAAELGTWDFNPVTLVLKWDERCRGMFGLTPDMPVDYNLFLDRLHPDDRRRVDETVQTAMDPQSGGHYDIEYRAIGYTDKKTRWLSAKGRALFDEQGRPYRFIGTILDITERKKTQERITRSEERLKEALTVADTGTWKIDLETGMDTRDASLNRILGLEAVETLIPVSDSFTRIHPADAARIQKALDLAVLEGGSYSEECRIYKPDGSMRWLRDRGRVVRDERGHPLYIIGAATDITDLKVKEESLRINEERFRGLFHNASVGMAIADLNGKFLEVNPVMCQITGYPVEEMIGRDVISLMEPHNHEETRLMMRELILGERDYFSTEKKYIRKNGTRIWVNTSVSAVRDENGHTRHFVGVIHNVHDRKMAEESLKLQARVLESMDEGVSVTDENGYILYTNVAEDVMFGYESGELLGKHVTIQNAYDAGENERLVSEVIAELMIHGYWNGEWHNKRKDGSTFYTFSHITSLDLGDRHVLVCVQRDITEEKKTQEALQKSHEQLELKVAERTKELLEANERLGKSNEELEQFAYVASHDLQEPLRKIKIFAHRVVDELKEQRYDKLHAYLDKLIGSADRMSTLIRDLLNYSKISQQKKGFADVDLNEILRDVLNDFEILIHQKNATVVSDDLPLVRGIPLQLNQLLYNLIGNSLKFSKPGIPPEISVRCRQLDEDTSAALGLPAKLHYELSIIDNGIGFSPRYREQVFEIFQRLHAKDQYAGTGIGLALSRRVVENHQGRIFAEPEEGKGTTFRIILPRDPDA